MSPDDITIRPGQLADAAILPTIERSAALLFGELEGLAGYVDGPVIDQVTHARWMSEGAYLVAEWGAGRRVGFLAARPTGNGELVIHDIAVRRAFQSRGIGKALLSRALSDARSRRIKVLLARADLDIPWVASFCSSAGLVAAAKPEVSPLALELGSQDPRVREDFANHAIWMLRPVENQIRLSISPGGNLELEG